MRLAPSGLLMGYLRNLNEASTRPNANEIGFRRQLGANGFGLGEDEEER